MTLTHPREFPGDLIQWRTKNGISLSAIAASTKISPRYLDAIESGKFGNLPGGVYGLNYIRQYAQAIHYEVDDLLEFYRCMTMPEEAVTAAPPATDGWAVRVWDRIRSLRGTTECGGRSHPRTERRAI